MTSTVLHRTLPWRACPHHETARSRAARRSDAGLAATTSSRAEPLEQRRHRHLQLDPGQRRAEAEVDAGAEGEVRVGRRGRRRSGPGRRSTPGRGWRRRAGPRPSRPRRSHRASGPAGRRPGSRSARTGAAVSRGAASPPPRARRRPASSSVAEHRSSWSGACEQRHHAVAEAVDARLVAGVEQQHDGRDQLVVVEPVAAVARLHEVGDQVVARVRAPALGRELVDVAANSAHARCASRPASAGPAPPRTSSRWPATTPQQVPVGRGPAEQLGDHAAPAAARRRPR